ncbi:MAG: adenylate/guanylate cyclase domain-containing protein [Rhodoferax sp.]|nr:adenylate/guanylate cyclase domain-containing protein [Rhodoferax sp.]
MTPWQRLARRHWAVGLSLLLGLLVWAAQALLAPGWLVQTQERGGDLAWRLAADRRDERRLIVVDIDERSLREVGPWPWPRATQARLMDRLAQAGASLQIYDIVFTDARPGDADLLAAAQRHRPVLAQIFALEQGGQVSSGKPAGALDWPSCGAPFSVASGYLANLPGLEGAATGHITPRVAPDGLVRQQPAVICHQGRPYPALALSALMTGLAEPRLSLQRGSQWLDPAWKLTAPALGAAGVPLDARGDLRVPWLRHPDSFISVSAADVLGDRLPPQLLERAWVLVGSTAFGLNDSIATPFGGTSSGLQVHAQVITALLDGRLPYTPRAEPLLQLAAAALGVALLLGLRRLRLPPYLLPLAALGWCALLWAAHALALTQGALWVGWADAALYTAAPGLALGMLEHARSRIERDRLYTHLSSYLPAPVAAALALQRPSSAITASTQTVSVMFADIRNFSAYVDARPPEEAAAVLHAFFSVAAQVVQAHGGVIEAFQGDAVMAVWNGEAGQPRHEAPQHAQRALQAAIALLAAMQGVLPDPAPAGLEPLPLGIGVETGPAMAGSFGLASRRTHMVMGRTVTIASRLVELTAELAHPILVGEGLAAQVGASGLESMGTFLLEGLRVPHHVYACPLVAAPRLPA